MQYFDQIPLSYIVSGLVGLLIILLYGMARLIPVQEGIFPKTWKLMAKLMDFVSGEISLVGHFLFGVLEEHVDEFFANERNLRNSAKLFKVMAFLIMCLTFYASFNSITEFFMALGFTLAVSRTLAIANDTFIGLAVVYRMYHAFKGQASMSGSISLFFFTALSFYFNIRHAADGSTAYWYDLLAGGGLAPLGLFISVEFMSKVIQSQTYREGAVRTDHQLAEQVSEHRKILEAIEVEIEEAKILRDQESVLNAKVFELRSDIEHLQAQIKVLDEKFVDRVPSGQGRIDQVRTLLDSGAGLEEVVDSLGVSEKTARSYIRTAQTNQNGQY